MDMHMRYYMKQREYLWYEQAQFRLSGTSVIPVPAIDLTDRGTSVKPYPNVGKDVPSIEECMRARRILDRE